ncbi:Immunoglobulin E-set [Phytophthora cactorum]|nr:Immunoglobulin E-set [Phytophthora cactorum]
MAKRESVEGVLGRLTIALEHESYASGEVVAGTVKLSTLELVQAREPLAVIVQGREEVAWDEGATAPSRTLSTRSFYSTRQTSSMNQIDLTLSTLYNASESEYRFSFQLPTDLPSSFELIDVYSGTAERLRVRVKYQATVWLRADSDSVAYLNAEQEFTVHAPPTITPPVQSLEILASEVVHWLCCINRGSLQMMIEIPKDVYPAGEVIPLQCRVDGSACKVSIKSTSVELVEDILLRNLGERADWTVTRVLSTQHVEGPSAGQTGEQTLRVGLVENEKEVPVNPDVTSHFFRCTHRLVVRCKPFMAQNIVAEVPVRVLHHNTSFSAGAFDC